MPSFEFWEGLSHKLLTNRITYFLEDNKLIHDHQYGFRRRRSTIDALLKFRNFVEAVRTQDLHSIAISLDFKNAFNNASWEIISKRKKDLNVPNNIAELINLINKRSVMYEMEDEYVFKAYNVGVPQGSSLVPILWLLVINTILKLIDQPHRFLLPLLMICFCL